MPHVSTASAASALSMSGVVLATFGPAIVLFGTFVAPRSDLAILTIAAASIWLCTITVVSAVWSILVPLREVYWVLVLYSAAAQECSRWLTYKMWMKLFGGMASIGMVPSVPREAASFAPEAIASGLGAGLTATLVIYGDTLVGALRPGSLYSDRCDGLSVFAAASLSNMAMTVLHVLLSLVGWTVAYPQRSRSLMLALFALHALASGATLLNAADVPGGGCIVALPCLFGVVAAASLLAARLAAQHLWVPRGKPEGVQVDMAPPRGGAGE